MKIIIIAEAGVNHNGDLKIAKKLIDVAKRAGADFVKFQTFKASNLATKYAPKAQYQTNYNKSESQHDLLQKLELNEYMHKQLIDYCEKKQIKFLSTGFDIESINLLVNLGTELIKIPSGEITNLPYLRHIGSLNKQVILSSGMANLEEIKEAIKILCNSGLQLDQITCMHCTTAYPTPLIDVNLKAMLTIQKELKVKIGYSDHTMGIEIPIAAAALGANVIEKHFTLDRNLEGPDHKASLEPNELIEMIKCIRNIETALGDGLKKIKPSEEENLNVARKSIVAKMKIGKNEIFTEKNLTTKRPGNGLSPMFWDDLIGKKSKREYLPDEFIDDET